MKTGFVILYSKPFCFVRNHQWRSP